MADTTADTGLLPRTYFRAPRVPLDLRALAIAVLGFGVFQAGSWLLDQIFNVSPVRTFFGDVWSVVREVPYVGPEIEKLFGAVLLGNGSAAGNFWQSLAGGVWFFVVWAFFGQAIHRITALRIARDEGLSLKEAFKFSAKNFVTILLCPVIVGLAIALFYGCNAAAGAVVSIPVAGEILSIILIPLAAISTLLILLIAIGGAIGMPLVAAAAAWERNGSLDAISRAFSYIFARPLQFFWNYFLIFLFTTVLLLAGGHFQRILYKSVDAGIWRTQLSMFVDTPTDGRGAGSTYEGYSAEHKELYREVDEKTEGARPFATSMKGVFKASWMDMVTAFVFWILLNLIKFGVVGTVLWWFLGATTSTYADLRSDVDGTEEDEIYLEEEEQDFESLAKPPECGGPAPAAPATTPPAPPPPAPPPPAPPAPPAPPPAT